MNETICHLEIFDEEIGLWEYVPVSSDPEPINCYYNNLEHFFSANLYYLFITLENEGTQSLFPMYKGLPVDCSEVIAKAYHFLSEEVRLCRNASYINLSDLFSFDYTKLFDLNDIGEKELEMLYPEIYESKKQSLTHKEWLGDDFFGELEAVKKRFDKYPKCRIVYFMYCTNLS
jgi:hypothetical protein